MKLDPAIWRERAELTLTVAIQDAIDAGATISAESTEVERIVRATRCPFGDEPTIAFRCWLATLDAAFAGRPRRRRKGGG